MDNQYINKVVTNAGLIWHTIHDNTIIGIRPLAFHVSVLIDVNEWDYVHRYCFCSTELAKIAIEEFIQTGEMKYYQKDHTNNISIRGQLAFENGALQVPENALHEVNWDADELSEQYPYNVVRDLKELDKLLSIDTLIHQN